VEPTRSKLREFDADKLERASRQAARMALWSLASVVILSAFFWYIAGAAAAIAALVTGWVSCCVCAWGLLIFILRLGIPSPSSGDGEQRTPGQNPGKD
jgi:hypothetical protein